MKRRNFFAAVFGAIAGILGLKGSLTASGAVKSNSEATRGMKTLHARILAPGYLPDADFQYGRRYVFSNRKTFREAINELLSLVESIKAQSKSEVIIDCLWFSVDGYEIGGESKDLLSNYVLNPEEATRIHEANDRTE